jgi:hypothetical protein
MLAVLASLALSQAATPQPQAVPGAPVDVVAPTQPRRICRIERDTSSRISGRRICQTVQERDAERADSQRNAQDAVNRQWDREQGDRPFGQFAQPEGTSFRQNEVSSTGLRGAPR